MLNLTAPHLNFNLLSPLSLRVYLTLLSCSVKGRGSQQDQPGLLVTDESGKEAAPGFSPPHPDTGQQAARDDSAAAPWRRPASLRARPSQRSVTKYQYTGVADPVHFSPNLDPILESTEAGFYIS